MTHPETCYKVVTDNRKPILIKHSDICYPPAHPDCIDGVDTSYPGIVLKYDNGYLLEDGCHRIAKLQKQGVFESLFYVVTLDEYKSGIVKMWFQGEWIILGEWNHDALDPEPHTGLSPKGKGPLLITE
jgi:hypothetical protein